ncbi:hypothetical protein PIB30_062216 [Stylosanthes scabra]|uniref:Uncharacterized protein n=1 Tax=Stylosanthes scabra TaxID=79078 RepID=A0ABU6ZJS4_9FABA|nr:hypothetical protein [Stylosanthes scabra]
MASGMLICVGSELVKTFSGLSRQADLETTFQRAVEICGSLKTLIDDADHKQLTAMELKKWMERIVDICYDMMYLLDELNLQVVGRVRVFSHQFSFFNPFRRHHQGMYRNLREVITGLETLVEDAPNGLGIQKCGRREILEIAYQKQNLLQSDSDLWQRNGRAPGMGKTALAQRVSRDARVKAYFGDPKWVSVSEEFNLRQIVMAILGFSTSDQMNDVEMELLVLMFRRVTAGKRCLFVLDDVINEDPERWQLIREFFNFCVAGSRILITTRDNRFAALASASEDIIPLHPLSHEDSWEIIRDTVYGPSTHPGLMEGQEISKEITKRCAGVPLYLRSAGAIMRYKRNGRELLPILYSDMWGEAQHNQLGPLLMLLYTQVSSYSKQCLLYCSIFPKDHIIVIDQLIQLWIAQGFIISYDDNHMEEQGRRIFHELSTDSFFKYNTIAATPGSTCLLESGISNLFHAMAENEYRTMLLDSGKKFREDGDVPINCRHCTLTIATHTCLPKSIPNAEKLHTLMILSQYSSVDPTNLSCLLSNLRRVRALILSSCSIKEIPRKVGKLLHLRYLDLSFNQDLKTLPGAICNLLYLQTLNLNGCSSLRKLPKACNIGDLEKLNNIQGKITIDGLGADTDASEDERAGLENKKGLRGLELWFTAPGAGTNDKRVLGALKAPPELKDLGIFYYRGELFPAWMIQLQKLTHLTLSDCEECSVLLRLGELPSLEYLKIMNMPSIKRVVDSEFLGAGSTDAFPKLRELSFANLDNWEEWVGLGDDCDQANVMPQLSSLSIVNCRKLKAIPNYIKLKRNAHFWCRIERRPRFRINIKKCPSLDLSHYDTIE